MLYMGTKQRSAEEEVARALEKWKAAAAYYESVEDPDLIDYAVYEMEAAQKRYTYLLKLSRQGG